MSSSDIYVPLTILDLHEDGSTNVYVRHEELGHGGFAAVYRVTKKGTDFEYAMKVIPKSRYEGPQGQKLLEKLKNEIRIQRSLNHPNIVKSYNSFSDAFNYYMVVEYCSGHTVKELMQQQDTGHFTEEETKKILRDVIRGVVYLHNKKIIHRDLKLENFMVGSDGKIKIADFGVSRHLANDNEKRFSICGTPLYFSPELVQKSKEGYSYEVDIWTIGICAYGMLTGYAPFDLGERKLTYEAIKRCNYRFPPYISISSDAKDFIHSILRVDPSQRPSAIDLLNHHFISYENSLGSEIGNSTTQETCRYRCPCPLPNAINNQNGTQLAYKLRKMGIPRYHYKGIEECKHYDDNDSSDETETLKNTNFSSTSKTNQSESSYSKDESVIFPDFTIPNSFITRFCLHGKDIGYLLGDGSVGACFSDKSRMIMDPYENFIQFYESPFSSFEVLHLQNSLAKSNSSNSSSSRLGENSGISTKIDLLKRFSRSMKKAHAFFTIPPAHYEEIEPLHIVKYWVKKNDDVLFKFNDKNIQVNFGDHIKLIILWEKKKMTLFRSITDNCHLFSLNDVINLNHKSNEYQRFHSAKKLLNELKSL